MRDIDIATLFSSTDIQDIDIHPAGRKAVCSINRGVNFEIAILNLTNGALKRLVTGLQSLMSPSFSPDGKRIAYHLDLEGNENHDIVVVGSDGKRARKITDSVEDNSSPKFSPNGESIAFVSNRVKDMDNLYIVNSRGGRIKRLTNEPLPTRQIAWSPDGTRIAYVTGVGDEDCISVVDVTKLKTKRLLHKRAVEYSLAGAETSADEWDRGEPSPWSPDGKNLLFLSNEHDWSDIGQLDLESMKARWLVMSKKDKYQPQWSPDCAQLAYLETSDPNMVVKVRSNGNTRVVSPPNGTSRALHWLPDGSGVLFVNESATRPEEIFMAKSGKFKQITKFMKKPLRLKALVHPRLIKYKSFDGLRIAAQLYVPRGGSRKAAIVYPHGGPEMMETNIWDQLAIMLVDKGFTLIKPNYRGSTGYGRRFLHLHDKDLGGGDYKDTVWAGKYLLDSGYADKSRLGYWGCSYSGFMSMLALTKYPDMWAAGVSIVGFFDWQTEHETERGFLKAYDESKMGDFKKDPDFFYNRSPINFLQNLRAPLLMTASSRDVRCPPTESRAVVQKLNKMGKVIEYHEYTDEGHWPRKRANLRDLYTRSARFLDEHIPK